MQKIGCSYGMELDINVTHVGLEYLNVLGPDEADPPGAKTFKVSKYFSAKGKWAGVKDFRYFMRAAIRGTGNSPFPRWTGRTNGREFFYLVRRDLLPGDPIKPLQNRPKEGRWTTASLPEEATATFPMAMTRTFLHPDAALPQHKIHLVRLDLRFLEASLCMPTTGASCLPQPGKKDAPLVVLPLGSFAADRNLVAGGRKLARGGGDAPHLVVGPLRKEGAALPRIEDGASADSESLSIQSAPDSETARVRAAVCSKDGAKLLYASGLGATRAQLARVLGHAGCERVIHLGAAEPLVLRRGQKLSTIFGQTFPPMAESPSLVFRRSSVRWAHRIFTHVEPQPRRVWTQAQPERTRSTVIRHATKITRELGLPTIKRVDDLCRPPYSDHPELKKLRWRDPITGVMCGKSGGKPRVKIDDKYRQLLKKRKQRKRRKKKAPQR